MNKTDVIVIGAGAAGLMCAATAGQRGRKVVLMDHSEKLAEKIRISGGGRCNFTNLNVRPECYLSNNPHFVKSALKQFTQFDFMALLDKHGLTYHEKTLGQLFCDQNSQGIIEMLKAEVNLGDVIWRMGTEVIAVAQVEGQFQVTTATEVWLSDALVIATGGLSIPQIGATAFGYEVAKQFGLNLQPLAAALVPLTFQSEDLWTELAGVALENVVVSCENTSFREAILLTHKGLSGPAILQISSFWQAGKTLEIDLIPDLDLADFLRAANRDALLSTVLADVLPKRFVAVWLAKYGEIRPLKQYTSKELQRLEAELHQWQIKPSGSLGYKKAEVTRGGVDTDQLLSKSMMAREIPGLYFIGEVVDVTGWLGGYNFQWAWSSGYVAGMNI
ncbi:NAD(P)/FAD-dependent oxidoreductase [Deefgea piscis]|uniref:NAD(P)/FAD-dependent oxidoreductase n=1 Tax=Deefgea piscis TaxID=2739061 RepID=A0A6M8STY4_9NEIS|nr:NAD(P)/FAD-dependent oxidoreductase [Deefgea piscis]QKJ65317.1 NAD(P)/FAD-dependent oxidoreductase [Deefgea piscis]